MLKFLCCGCCCSKSQEIESKVESSARLIIDEANQNSNSNFDPEEIEEEGEEIGISLDPLATLEPPAFEKMWKSMQVATSFECSCQGEMEFEAVENYFEEYYIRTLAKGKTADGFRYYFYGVEEESDEYCLCELMANTKSKIINVTIKSSLKDFELIKEFSNLIEVLAKEI